jgi:hypothetical protein
MLRLGVLFCVDYINFRYCWEYVQPSLDIMIDIGLGFNNVTHNFTLRIVDTKRVSKLKSLTPKRITKRNENNNEV